MLKFTCDFYGWEQLCSRGVSFQLELLGVGLNITCHNLLHLNSQKVYYQLKKLMYEGAGQRLIFGYRSVSI